MIDLDLLLKLILAMNREGVEYITFGAIALMTHGIVRNTEAADFFVFTPGGLMPVWKYTSIEETLPASTLYRDLPVGKRIRSILRMARLIEPLGMPRGVRKFRSNDEANAEREQYERARVARIRSRNR